jgi:hypothetical protein
VLLTVVVRATTLFSALGVAALASCAGPAGPDAGVDGGRDGGRDAGRDGGGRDGGPRDAGTDAGRDGGPDDAIWVPLADVPADCVGRVHRALRPEVMLTVEWGACDPPAPGCERQLLSASAGVR